MWFRTEDPGDPRHRVTETGFRVDPDLLGRPLAHPGRRLAALLVDLSAVGGLVLSRVISPWFFALVGGWLLWRVADPDADVRLPSARLRKLFRAAAVGVGGTALVVLVAGLFDGEGESSPSASAPATGVADRAYVAGDSAAARRRAVRDSLLGVLAAAADTGARDRIQEVATRLLGVPARPEVRQLQARVEQLEDELDEERRAPSLVATAWGLMNDLGLGLGWLGAYFTAFLALWRGRTPGKKLLGIRVARIDGREVDTWTAFTRFGGYAACVITGLLGFVQVVWHPNRQGLHDRVAGTVVIEE